jgi:hypothetical protein
MGLTVRREVTLADAAAVTTPAVTTPAVTTPVPRMTFRAWLVLRLGPPPQPPRRYFSKSMHQGGSYRAVPGPRRPL